MRIYWSNARYGVWSTHVNELEPDNRQDVLEVRRTDAKVAQEDAALIRDILKRKAWVQDSESK